MTIKILYAEKRRPELSREAFSRGWRIHAGDAMKCGDFWDPILFYVQNDAPARPTGIAGVDASYDCVGEVCYATHADCDASIAAPSLPGITQDGDHIFSRIDQISMIAEHRAIIDRRAGDIKLFVFARFGDAAGLHDDRVQPGRRIGQTGQRLSQAVRIDAAAQASVAEADRARALPGHQQRVDVDRTEVVDDHPQSRTHRIGEQRVEQCRLARTQKSGDDDHRDRLPVPAHAHEFAGATAVPAGTQSGHTTRSSRPSRSG